MKYNFLSSLITLSVIVYAIKHIAYKIMFSIKYVKQFYTKRMVLPSVRVWDNKILKAAYNHIFSLLETIIFTTAFLMVYTATSNLKSTFIMFFLYSAIVIQTKVSFSSMITMYPKSLLIFNIITSLVLSISEYVVLCFFCTKLFSISF